MPKILRSRVPAAVIDHLVTRCRNREIPMDQLALLAQWMNTGPEVPAGHWFKRFPGMIACGDGELVKTFLRIGQLPTGEVDQEVQDALDDDDKNNGIILACQAKPKGEVTVEA